jgi:hypothetical protein
MSIMNQSVPAHFVRGYFLLFRCWIHIIVLIVVLFETLFHLDDRSITPRARHTMHTYREQFTSHGASAVKTQPLHLPVRYGGLLWPTQTLGELATTRGWCFLCPIRRIGAGDMPSCAASLIGALGSAPFLSKTSPLVPIVNCCCVRILSPQHSQVSLSTELLCRATHHQASHCGCTATPKG